MKKYNLEFTESFDKILLTDYDEWHRILNTHSPEEHEAEPSIISESEMYPWKDIVVNPHNTKRMIKTSVQATL